MAYPIGLPPGVPTPIVEALQAAFDATMTDPEFLRDAQKSGLEVSPLGGKAIEALMRQIDQTPQAVVDRLIDLTAPRK